MRSIKCKRYIYTHLCDFSIPEHLIWTQDTMVFFLFGHIIQRISLQQLEFQLFKVHSSNPANKAAKQKMKENKLLDRAASPASHWQYLRHVALNLSATGHVSIPGDWALRLWFWLPFISQAGVHLLVTLLPSFPLVLLSEGENWNCMKEFAEICRCGPTDENVSPVSYKKRQQWRICSLFHTKQFCAHWQGRTGMQLNFYSHPRTTANRSADKTRHAIYLSVAEIFYTAVHLFTQHCSY